ncbi:hypothetical protein GCM10008905_29640 [Clostridium malenominatum]|uniref:Uncharacterized protein n=1 Tax=Clostridium malenominatum TaxID=1539 RepID=A0ABP3UDA1_9CLOT
MLKGLIKDKMKLVIFVACVISIILLITYFKTGNVKVLVSIFILLDIGIALNIYQTATIKEYKTYKIIILIDLLHALWLTSFVIIYSKGLQNANYWLLNSVGIALLASIKPVFMKEKYKNKNI